MKEKSPTYLWFLDRLQSAKINSIKRDNSEYHISDDYGIIDDIKEKVGEYENGNGRGRRFNKGKFTQKFDFIGEMWEIGGVNGGSCWDDSDPQEYSCGDRNKPKSFAALDKILGLMCPSITFLQYKLLEGQNDIVLIGEAIDWEYYGNRTDYSYRIINLEKLYKYLVDNKLI